MVGDLEGLGCSGLGARGKHLLVTSDQLPTTNYQLPPLYYVYELLLQRYYTYNTNLK
jgi:hypothetical protein